MPEGDTIHYAANRIRPLLLGAVPSEIVTPQRRHEMDRWPLRLAGRAVSSVDAHGKHLFIRFEGDLTLHSHLRMTGMWGVYRQGQRWRRSPRRAWLVLRVAGGEVVQFDGPLLELMTESRTRFDQRLVALGQDILGETFDEAEFLARARAAEQQRPVGDVLLDQRMLAGIGNVWKAESCFAAQLSPWRHVADTSDDELLTAVRFAREHMAHSARVGSITRPSAVYRRVGMACPRCGSTILSRGQGDDNRITYWCPGCQR